jgi:hypothetical protein
LPLEVLEEMKEEMKENMKEDTTADMKEVKQLEATKELEAMGKKGVGGSGITKGIEDVIEKSFGRGSELTEML